MVVSRLSRNMPTQTLHASQTTVHVVTQNTTGNTSVLPSTDPHDAPAGAAPLVAIRIRGFPFRLRR